MVRVLTGPGSREKLGNFVFYCKIYFLYLPFTHFGSMCIEQQVSFQEIFNTCCESLKKYNFD